MDNIQEIWKDVVGYEGYYQISNYGRLKSIRWTHKIIKPKATLRSGYPCFRLIVNGVSKEYSIHRLVAIHFIPNPDNKSTVNHIDENKLNFSIKNLEWVSTKENVNHSTKTYGKGVKFIRLEFWP